MENTSLYAQKVVILSRLIKESSLTLEEALLLLKTDEVVEPDTVSTSPNNSSSTLWINSGTPSAFTITSNGNVGIGTSTSTSSYSMDIQGVTSFPFSQSAFIADLNN